MNKSKLLYASPFSPVKSGISEYSEILVSELIKYFDVTLYINDYELESDFLKSNCRIVKEKENSIDFEEYEYRIYNIGNNPYAHQYLYEKCLKYPGMIILHDLVLYYLFIGYHFQKGDIFATIYQNEGMECFKKIKRTVNMDNQLGLENKKLASQFALNKEIIESGNKIMVHSEYALQKIKELSSETCVRQIPMIRQVHKGFENIDRNVLFERYGIPKDKIILASFGYIGETKLNDLICRVVKKIVEKSDLNVCYLMVGEGDFANEYVDNEIIYKLGYTDIDEFNSFISYSDVVLNLRYPSMGETSASMLRIMEMGKACIINNDGWFKEIPDACAQKIPINHIEYHLENTLEDLIKNEEKRIQIGQAAREYVEHEYDTEKIIKSIMDFLTEK